MNSLKRTSKEAQVFCVVADELMQEGFSFRLLGELLNYNVSSHGKLIEMKRFEEIMAAHIEPTGEEVQLLKDLLTLTRANPNFINQFIKQIDNGLLKLKLMQEQDKLKEYEDNRGYAECDRDFDCYDDTKGA